MNLPPPMNTRRVQEALASLTDHVVNARDIAAGIKPVSLVKPLVEPAVDIPVPRIESIQVKGRSCRVLGKNLAKVVTFRLDPVAGTPGGRVRANIKNATQTTLEAGLVSDPSEGGYLAWAVDDQMRGDVMLIEIGVVPGPVPGPGGHASCKVAAVVPNEVVVMSSTYAATTPKEVFVKVTSAGDRFPDDVVFVSQDGAELTCGAAILSGDPKVRVVPIHIHSSPGAGQSRQVMIDVKPSGSAAPEASFHITILQP